RSNTRPSRRRASSSRRLVPSPPPAPSAPFRPRPPSRASQFVVAARLSPRHSAWHAARYRSSARRSSMRNLIALALLASHVFFVPQTGHAAAPRNLQAHVSISDAGEYSATVSSAGEPTTLWVRSRGESIELRIQFQDPTRLHYEIRRVGDRQFHMSGA